MSMIPLLLGLAIFLGAHSVRIAGPEWRNAQVASLGADGWKKRFTVASLVGFVVLVWGYGLTRGAEALWQPAGWSAPLAVLSALLAFILITAAYVPGNHIKTVIGHPMALGVAFWSLGHLLANTRPGDVLLFGSFLVWALASFFSARRRDRAAGTTYPAKGLKQDVLTVVIGVAIWAIFGRVLHAWLIGAAPQ